MSQATAHALMGSLLDVTMERTTAAEHALVHAAVCWAYWHKEVNRLKAERRATRCTAWEPADYDTGYPGEEPCWRPVTDGAGGEREVNIEDRCDACQLNAEIHRRYSAAVKQRMRWQRTLIAKAFHKDVKQPPIARAKRGDRGIIIR